MYEILAGEAPFSGPTAQVVLSRVLTETPRPLRNVRHSLSPATEAMVFKAMARVPADRFATAEEFRAELDRAANELRTVTPSHAAAVTIRLPASSFRQREPRTG